MGIIINAAYQKLHDKQGLFKDRHINLTFFRIYIIESNQFS